MNQRDYRVMLYSPKEKGEEERRRVRAKAAFEEERRSAKETMREEGKQGTKETLGVGDEVTRIRAKTAHKWRKALAQLTSVVGECDNDQLQAMSTEYRRRGKVLNDRGA